MPLNDNEYIAQQYKNRQRDHGFKPSTFKCDGVIQVGDLVYLYSDKDKVHSRPRYLVSHIEDEWCYLRKFIGNQLRNNAYKVHRNDCFKVPANDTDSRSAVPKTGGKFRFPSSAQPFVPFGNEDVNIAPDMFPRDQNLDVGIGAPLAPPVPREITEPLDAPDPAPAVPFATSPPRPAIPFATSPPPTPVAVLPPQHHDQQETVPEHVGVPETRSNPGRRRRPPSYLEDYDRS